MAHAVRTMNGHLKIAKNSVTGLYWNGRSFSVTVLDAAILTPSELAVLRATYDNVVDEIARSGIRWHCPKCGSRAPRHPDTSLAMAVMMGHNAPEGHRCAFAWEPQKLVVADSTLAYEWVTDTAPVVVR